LALIGAGFVFFFLRFFLAAKKKVKIYSVLAVVVLMLSFFGFRAAYQNSESLRDVTPQAIGRYVSISFFEGTAKTRLMAWEIALKGFMDKPLFGWGAENFEHVFDEHYNKDFVDHSFMETRWNKVHNYHLEVLVNMGIFTFISYIALYFFVFRILWKGSVDKDNTDQKAFILLFSLFTAYVIQNTFAFDTINSFVYFFFCLAFLSSFGLTKEFSFSKFKKVFALLKKIFPLFLVIFILFFFLKSIFWYNSSRILATARDHANIGDFNGWSEYALKSYDYDIPNAWDRSVFLIQDLMSLDSSGKITKQELEKLLELIEKDLIRGQEKTSLVFYDFWLAQLYVLAGEYVGEEYFQKAEELLKTAMEKSPEKPHYPILLGRIYMFDGNAEKSVEVLTELLEKKDFIEARWLRAIAFLSAGDRERGLEEIEKAEEFGKKTDAGVQYMIDLYAEEKEYDKIIELYDFLIIKYPEREARYRANMGATYMEAGEIEKSLIEINKAIELDIDLLPEAQNFLKLNNININDYAHIF